MSDFLNVLRGKLQDKINERAGFKAELDATLEEPAAEARDLNTEESAKFAELRGKIAHLDNADEPESIPALEARVKDLEAGHADHEGRIRRLEGGR